MGGWSGPQLGTHHTISNHKKSTRKGSNGVDSQPKAIAHENDTIVSISRAQQPHANGLFEQNFVSYEQKLRPTDKLLRGIQLRLPMRV